MQNETGKTDPWDECLARLGRGTPFPVDWEAYSRELIARLARLEVRRRRTTLALTLGGMLAGAAASWLLALLIFQPSVPANRIQAPLREPARPGLESPTLATTILEEAPANLPTYAATLRRANGSTGIIRALDAPAEVLQPFICRKQGPGGRISEILFHGYTPDGQEGGGIAIAVRPEK